MVNFHQALANIAGWALLIMFLCLFFGDAGEKTSGKRQSAVSMARWLFGKMFPSRFPHHLSPTSSDLGRWSGYVALFCIVSLTALRYFKINEWWAMGISILTVISVAAIRHAIRVLIVWIRIIRRKK